MPNHFKTKIDIDVIACQVSSILNLLLQVSSLKAFRRQFKHIIPHIFQFISLRILKQY